jgi:hypothetical protein
LSGARIRSARHANALYTPQQGRAGCLSYRELGDNQLVEVAPAAAEMLPANQPRTVKDLLDLPTWPYGRLRIVIERRPLIEVMIELPELLGPVVLKGPFAAQSGFTRTDNSHRL